MTCNCCERHQKQMRRSWMGTLRALRRDLAAVRAANRKADAEKIKCGIRTCIAKLRENVIKSCRWSAP